MYYAPTDTQIKNLGLVFSINLEECPVLDPGTTITSYHFVARVRERPVLSRKIFKCSVHELRSNKTLAFMRLRPCKIAQFRNNNEMESYMRLAVQTMTQVAINRGFGNIRLSSPVRMLEDVIVDSGFNTITKSKVPNSSEFTYNGCKQLK